MVNNTSLILSIVDCFSPNLAQRSVARARVSSDPCLPARLPTTGFLQREAEQNAPRAVLRQLRRSPTPPSPTTEYHDATEDAPPHVERRGSVSSESDQTSSTRSLFSFSRSQPSGGWKEPQPFEVFRAIERKDIMFLMEVRDRAFPLLLRKTGDATPLLHAMRIGQSHRDVAILLLGAFSRWINHLEDSEINLPRTRVILKALRTNLKLGIDYGLYKSQSDLVASFMQTLVMSEGEKWIRAQVSSASLALRSGNAGKPVSTAEAAVRKFATKELSKADAIAALEDYVANATTDLLLLGAWAIALESIEGQPIPVYYFARDDRVFKAFMDRANTHQATIRRVLSRRLKWQFRVLQNVLEGRNTTYRRKVEILTEELDDGDGV
ncbi:uncharacterized protein F5891DRAFT_1125198 [Suillus fuscotomentosus]|uniref:Uncharacterized protein n=1 Tax=Suillus fuscotomentosus TaxID=1912939 RepID=A0AAD4EJN9_9AGAM|nr:uncharacterized protein F5891DRAFT_1125198 [Suillus fuscotomentosus]KAG1907291.1 hypothetical protein F5891DRAFT_1125198 [Suillus fuscotomentosus]